MKGAGEATGLEGVKVQSGLGVPWPGHLAGRATTWPGAVGGGGGDSQASLSSWLNIIEQEKVSRKQPHLTRNHTASLWPEQLWEQ